MNFLRDCDDGNQYTRDSMLANGTCVHVTLPCSTCGEQTCLATTDCTDFDFVTDDSCSGSVCTHANHSCTLSDVYVAPGVNASQTTGGSNTGATTSLMCQQVVPVNNNRLYSYLLYTYGTSTITGTYFVTVNPGGGFNPSGIIGQSETISIIASSSNVWEEFFFPTRDRKSVV